jgi:hypothetical protein
VGRHGSSRYDPTAADAHQEAILRALIAQAWHDVTCPEGPDCRDRTIHSAAQVLASTGILSSFLHRLDELVISNDRLPRTAPMAKQALFAEPPTTPMQAVAR